MKPLVALTILMMVLACGGVSADNTGNDRVLRGDKKEFIEVFKKDDAGGDKNYLYTITEFKDMFSRDCTVVTGDSEKTIALDCEFPRG
jgi:hypothetical protein